MKLNEYQRLAERTECNQGLSLDRIKAEGVVAVRVMHGLIGLQGEVGEIASNVEKWIYYGQGFDKGNIKEELGDCLWYIAEICNALNLSLAEVMSANIRKLQVRYRETYDDRSAREENRDRKTEAEVLEQNGQGWAEPPDDTEDSETPISLARRIADTYLDGRSRSEAIAEIERVENA